MAVEVRGENRWEAAAGLVLSFLMVVAALRGLAVLVGL